MGKPSLLFASPFPPLQTGIADLSVLLVEALREHFELTLLTDEPDRCQFEGLQALACRPEAVDWDRYRLRLYNIGNNPWYHGNIYHCCLRYPGVVLLHEPVIYYLYVGCYRTYPDFYDRVLSMEGPSGLAMIRWLTKQGRDLLDFSEPQSLPFNKELIDSGNRFLVHSQYALRHVLARATSPVVVSHIPQAVPALPAWSREDKLAARGRLGISEDAKVMASFGFVAPTKLNDVICRAINRLNSEGPAKAHYVMVGAGSYVDAFRSDYIRVTGYIDTNQYDDYLAACDLVLNLRYPTMGETSAAALRALRTGKPCVFNNVGWFTELPDNIAVKIEPDPSGILCEMLYRLFRLFLEDPSPFEELGANAAKYIADVHDTATIARRIADFLNSPS